MRAIIRLFVLGSIFPLAASAQLGTDCPNADPIGLGTHTAPFDNYWYSFVPDSSGVHYLHTCGLSGCDTKLWVYDHCGGLVVNEQGLNAIAYNDDYCGLQTYIAVTLLAGQTYYIRTGDYEDACVNDGQLVTWEIFIPDPPPPASCDPGEVPVTVVIVPDAYPAEIHWQLTDGGGNLLADGGAVGEEVCVDTGACVVFTITDDYGDGIFAPGGYWVYYNGSLFATGYNFGGIDQVEMNCPLGFSCTQAETIVTGDWTAPEDNYWYSFTPDSNGTYLVTTCGGNTCDTKIWIYDHCEGLVYDESNIATIYYDDNNGGCGLQAQINAGLEGSVEYWIRIGDAGDDCGGGPVNWTLTYMGPITGCTDPASCNFNPLAVLDDGSCIPWGDPDCPNGPDLVADEAELQSSLYVSTVTVNPGDCYISEGCLTGFGTRELIRFSTRVANIGQADYYIGSPSANPDQFVFSPCHNHWHYQGYAEYLLFDTAGQQVDQGYKNGFCVLDLDCSGGGTAQYGCSDMGISAGCADIYSSGLACQWIDITDVPEGLYTLVVRVNWDNDPDALGHYEISHVNNWAQACIFIDRTPTLAVSLQTDCEPYVDCLGEIYGSAQMDCDGVCNGTRLIGDLDVDIDQDIIDAQTYVTEILADNISALPCNDADADGHITVTDAALVNRCSLAHLSGDSASIATDCAFPLPEIINIYDSVTFSIGSLDLMNSTLDIWMRNPNKNTIGYELLMSGIEITGVDNLVDAIEYPITPAFDAGGMHVIGLSYEDSTVERSSSFQPLCRVHFTNPGAIICIDSVIDVVNEDHNNSIWFLDNACVVSTGLSDAAIRDGVRVFPNPFTDETIIYLPTTDAVRLELTDLQGRVVLAQDRVTAGRCVIQRGSLGAGTYLYTLSGAISAAGRLVME